MPPKNKKKTNPSDTEDDVNDISINSSVIEKLIKTQIDHLKSHFDSAISKQAESLKIHFNSAIENLNLKVDKLSKDITNLESSLEYSQQDISELKVNMATQHESLLGNSRVISNLDSEMIKIKSKLAYLENQSRRNNIRINGIPADFNETWEQTEEKARKILKDRLNLEIEPQFERAHRTGRKRNLDGSIPLDLEQ
jgi:chromosome segregation ATPase